MHRSWRVSPRDRGNDGAAAVEFAIVSVLLLTIVFAILQYSVYFWSLQSGEQAAREAARQAAVGDLSCSDFEDAVLQNTQGEDASTVTATRTFYSDVSMSTEASPPVVGGVVKVTVRYNSLDFHLPFVPFINDGLVSEESVARVESTTSDSVKCP